MCEIYEPDTEVNLSHLPWKHSCMVMQSALARARAYACGIETGCAMQLHRPGRTESANA